MKIKVQLVKNVDDLIVGKNNLLISFCVILLILLDHVVILMLVKVVQKMKNVCNLLFEIDFFFIDINPFRTTSKT
jgi:hypothetical protein